MTAARVPAGVRTGGQFATGARAESAADLTAAGDPTCEFCPAAASARIQAYTSRGPVGEPRYSCAEHQYAPTFSSFGGGWTERSAIAPAPEPTWAPSPEDPDVLWLSGDGPAAQIVTERQQVPASADYDLPHVVEAHTWLVDDPATGTVLAEGVALSLTAAQRAAAAAMSAPAALPRTSTGHDDAR